MEESSVVYACVRHLNLGECTKCLVTPHMKN